MIEGLLRLHGLKFQASWFLWHSISALLHVWCISGFARAAGKKTKRKCVFCAKLFSLRLFKCCGCTRPKGTFPDPSPSPQTLQMFYFKPVISAPCSSPSSSCFLVSFWTGLEQPPQVHLKYHNLVPKEPQIPWQQKAQFQNQQPSFNKHDDI